MTEKITAHCPRCKGPQAHVLTYTGPVCDRCGRGSRDEVRDEMIEAGAFRSAALDVLRSAHGHVRGDAEACAPLFVAARAVDALPRGER